MRRTPPDDYAALSMEIEHLCIEVQKREVDRYEIQRVLQCLAEAIDDGQMYPDTNEGNNTNT